MTEESTEEIKLDSPRKPLEPVGDRVSDEQRAAYAKLLAEYERIEGIRDAQIEGVSVSFDKGKMPYTVEAYNGELAAYRKSRVEYNRRFADSVETIDMVRAKLERMCEADEQYEKNRSDVECPKYPWMEFFANEPWDEGVTDETWNAEFERLYEEFNKKFQEWNEYFTNKRLRIRMEEMSKFPELKCEVEKRLRHGVCGFCHRAGHAFQVNLPARH